MKKYIILLLCLVLIITGCGNKTNPPKGMSKEFYETMLAVDKLIQKSIDAKFNYLEMDEYIDAYSKQIDQYIYATYKDEMDSEQKQICINKNIDTTIQLTDLEKTTVKSLCGVYCELSLFIELQDDNKKQDLDENYKRFKKLLEP